MPTTYQGTLADRLARMEREGRRCDANSRNCPRTAVEQYTLMPADGHGTPLPDASPVTRQSCSNHRQQFLRNGLWHLIDQVDLPHKGRRVPPKG